MNGLEFNLTIYNLQKIKQPFCNTPKMYPQEAQILCIRLHSFNNTTVYGASLLGGRAKTAKVRIKIRIEKCLTDSFRFLFYQYREKYNFKNYSSISTVNTTEKRKLENFYLKQRVCHTHTNTNVYEIISVSCRWNLVRMFKIGLEYKFKEIILRDVEV